VRRAAFVVPFLIACTGAPPPPKSAGPRVAGKTEAPGIAHPARWTFRAPSRLEARLEIDGGALFAGRGGERWRIRANGAPLAAEALVPHAVIGISLDESRRYLFLAPDGRVSIAREPLGPILETRTPPSPMRTAAASRKAVVGLGPGGDVRRSTDGGATWTPITLPKGGGTPTQIAMLPSGEGLILCAPQRLLSTRNDGATWEDLPTPGIGARRVVADANGDLVLEGLLASAILRHDPSGAPRLEKISYAPSLGHELAESSDPDGGGDLAADLRKGIATIDGDRVVRLVEDGIEIGPLGGERKKRPLPKLDDCLPVGLAARRPTIVLSCVTGGEPRVAPGVPRHRAPTTFVRLLRSDDDGATFRDDGRIQNADLTPPLWLAPDGALIVDGVCKPTKEGIYCDDSPPLVRPPGSTTFAKVTNRSGTRFRSVVFGAGLAVAIGSDRDERATLFVSNDGGRSFASRRLPPPQDDDDASIERRSLDDLAPNDLAASISDDGTIHVIARARDRTIVHALPRTGPPRSKVVPLDLVSGDLVEDLGFARDFAGRYYETKNGGFDWALAEGPAIDERGEDEPSIRCVRAGCVVGARATRLGWNLGGAEASPSARAKDPVARTAIVCEPSSEWRSLGHMTAPGIGNADLGGGTRFVLARREPHTGATSAVVATATAKEVSVKEVPLFGDSRDAASHVAMQLEGVAALRYRITREGKAPASGPIARAPVDVELAWYLAETGKVHRAKLPAVSMADPGRDVRGGPPYLARVGLLSIAHGGVHVRPFAASGDGSPFWFVGENGKREELPWPELPKRDVRGASIATTLDGARIGGRSVLFGSTGGGLQLLVASRAPGASAWEVRAWGLHPVDDDATPGLRFLDSGPAPSLGVLSVGRPDARPGSSIENVVAGGGARSIAWSIAIEGARNDPRIVDRLPTAEEFADPLPVCTGAQPPLRFVMPWSIGTRRAVIVEGLDPQPLVLASGLTIARTGGGRSACITTIEAESSGPTGAFTALIPADDLGRATLFRHSPGLLASEVASRSLRCRYEPRPLPASLAKLPGFRP
jgi:hypothetical protein